MTEHTSSSPVPTIDLRAGSGTTPIPQLGFGVYKVPAAEAESAVRTALEAGYRHVDTARLYGNEEGVGRAVAGRDDVFVTTKVWNDDHGYDEALAAFDASAARLALGRPLDLLLIHWPVISQGKFVDTYRALMTLRDSGKVRAIGVSNFPIAQLEELHAAVGEWPAINQVELHPYFSQQELRDFHAAHDIVTEAWAPLSRGGELFADPVVVRVADAHGRTPAQIVLRWHLQLGNVVIPKSVTPSRIAENFDVFDFELSDDEMEQLSALTRADGRLGPNPQDMGA